jgi:hypothetical protein
MEVGKVVGMNEERRTRPRKLGVDPIPCPECREPVWPHWKQEALVFLCDRGHESGNSELVAPRDDSFSSYLGLVLREWETGLRTLRMTAADAYRCGHHQVADLFHRHAGNIQARVQALREALVGVNGRR